MLPAFKTVALIGRYNTTEIAESLLGLAELLQQRGCTVLIEKETAANIGRNGFTTADYSVIGAQAELAVVLGGDGSMLSAARHLAVHGVPLVGVNQGRLGFMTDIAFSRMRETIELLLSGKYTIGERTMLEAQVLRGDKEIFSTQALNDVVVNKGGTGRMIEFLVHIDGQFVYDLRSDGIIVATPTGSTAYALSSNGPILQPNVPGIALVPVCPHTLSNRPITVSDRCVVEISIKKRAVGARLHVDGQPHSELAAEDRVIVRRSAHSIRFVHPPGYSYYAMLREKLHWSEM
ncbi:MAG: NAD kinase [Burkholderiales bacterium]|nr:NAD kinase [Burkholderiales bacterium]